jgi:hypothetical protein
MDLQSAFPAEFPFYREGAVRAERGPAEHGWAIPPGSQAAAITLQGDLRGVFLLIFESELDASMYAEMANVLASRFVTDLAAREQIDVVISPPRQLSFDQLFSLIVSDENLVRKSYAHLHAGREIPVEAVILRTPEVAAHA